MPRPRFLIVEDSPVVRLTIRTALERGGVETDVIAEADTAARAIEEFDRARPDAAFVDISLPVGKPVGQRSEGIFGFLSAGSSEDGGLVAARYMMEHHPALRMVVSTGVSPQDPRVQGLVRDGAFAVLAKPLKGPDLRETVRRVQAELDGSADSSVGGVARR